MTTKGWDICVKWKDGSIDWIPLAEIKNNNPSELASYAAAHDLQGKPAFAWWVLTALRHQRRCIKKVKKKYWQTTHKFGARLPKTVEGAYEINEQTETDFSPKAINTKLNKVSWEARRDLSVNDVRHGKELKGYKEIKVHMVFDVKMDFTRKAWFCARGHVTDAPKGLTDSSVVSRDLVRLAFLLAELNGVDVLAGEAKNAYLNAPCHEQIWFLGTVQLGNKTLARFASCSLLYMVLRVLAPVAPVGMLL